MTKPHVRIENDLFDHILLCNFGKRQLKIIFLIYRLSIGCQREWAQIPQKKDFEAIGITQNHIKHEINWLMSTRVILSDGNLYKINPDFSDWVISPVNTYEPTQINRLLILNLSTSQNGKSELPKTGSEEGQTSQKRKFTLPEKGSASDINLATPTNNITNNSVCVNKQQQLTTLYSTLHNAITPKISADIGKFLETYSPDEIDYAIRESARRGGKSSNYLQSILENRAADQWDTAPAADIRAELAALNKSKLLPPPSLPPADAWARSLEMIKPQMTTIGFDARFCDCAAVRWDGFCLILRAAPGCNNAEYKQFAGMIRSALIKVLDSDNVDYEFEREVEHAIQT